MRSSKRGFSSFLFLVLFGLILSVQSAESRPLKAAIAIDGHTGRTVYSRHANRLRYPASLTKVMTLYILFQEMRKGRLSNNSRLKVSHRAASRPPSKIGLRPGSTIKVKDAIMALVIKSANDVASVVAEAISGSERAFARRMTRTARRMGMYRTSFRNASGLPHRWQRTTARDMARLALRIQRDFPKKYKYFSRTHFKYKGRIFRTHNPLLGRFKGTDGIKTGYTRASGFNLISSVRRGRKHVITVVLGGRTSLERNRRVRAITNRAFRRVAAYSPRKRKIRKIRKRVMHKRKLNKSKLRKKRIFKRKVKRNNLLPPRPPRPPRTRKLKRRRLKPTINNNRNLFAPTMTERQHPRPGTFATAQPRLLDHLPPLKAANIQPTAFRLAPRPTKPAEPQLAPPTPDRVRIAQLSAYMSIKPTVLQSKTPSLQQSPAWIVQIGAYARKYQAQDRLNEALLIAQRALGNRKGFVMKYALNNNKAIYRSRFGGFTKQGAQNICQTLARHNITCYALTP